jgi:hypothetical protein
MAAGSVRHRLCDSSSRSNQIDVGVEGGIIVLVLL